jgi:hypothetical protein
MPPARKSSRGGAKRLITSVFVGGVEVCECGIERRGRALSTRRPEGPSGKRRCQQPCSGGFRRAGHLEPSRCRHKQTVLPRRSAALQRQSEAQQQLQSQHRVEDLGIIHLPSPSVTPTISLLRRPRPGRGCIGGAPTRDSACRFDRILSHSGQAGSLRSCSCLHKEASCPGSLSSTGDLH